MEFDLKDRLFFDFFALPRELRDEIYSLMTKSVKLESGMHANGEGPKGIAVSVANAPIQNLLLLNHQFKSEYKEQIDPLRTIQFRDTGGDLNKPTPKIDLSLFKKSEMDLLALCTAGHSCDSDWCDAAEDILTHAGWISGIIESLANLEDLKIRLFIDWKTSGKPKWPAPSHGPDSNIVQHVKDLTSSPKLSRLEIYPFRWSHKDDNANNRTRIYEEHEELVALWTKEKRWVEVVDWQLVG